MSVGATQPPPEVVAPPARTGSPPASGSGASSRLRRTAVPWLFLVPGLLLAAVFKLYPMVEGVRLSFYDPQPFLGDIWVGLDNYRKVLGDDRFREASVHTLVLATGQTVGAVVVGLALALLLEGSARFLVAVRTAVLLPVVTAVAVVGEIWRILLFPTEQGFVNSVLGVFGIGAQPFLSSSHSALLTVILVGVWTMAPYNMVIFLAGLADVDRGLYEAAALDGAGPWQRLRYVVLPALRPALSVVLTLAAIRGLRVFTEVYVLTGGGPAGSTEVWMTRVYSVGFDANELGVASAASVLLLVATLGLTLLARMATSRRGATP